MTPVVTDTVIAITSNPGDPVSTALSVIATLLLLALLCQREVFRALGGARSRVWIATLDTAIVPLLVTFGCIVLARLLRLLGVG